MLVSVIVPCFNQGRFLPETVGSVLTQSYPHVECLIVDDGSTDATEARAREAGAVVIKHGKNKGKGKPQQ